MITCLVLNLQCMTMQSREENSFVMNQIFAQLWDSCFSCNSPDKLDRATATEQAAVKKFFCTTVLDIAFESTLQQLTFSIFCFYMRPTGFNHHPPQWDETKNCVQSIFQHQHSLQKFFEIQLDQVIFYPSNSYACALILILAWWNNMVK